MKRLWRCENTRKSTIIIRKVKPKFVRSQMGLAKPKLRPQTTIFIFIFLKLGKKIRVILFIYVKAPKKKKRFIGNDFT